jgi:hypothetical protein
MALFRLNPEPRRSAVSHISWSAIIAGTLVGLMTQVTLLLLGTSIGLYSIEVSGGVSQFGGLGVGASIWWVISAILSLFVGGWLASRFAGLQRVFDGILHGVITWAAVTVLTLTVLTNIAGGILGGTFGAMGTVVSAVGQSAGTTLGSGEVEAVREQAEQLGGEVLGAGEQVAEVLGGAALWAFFAMILGAGAAAYGAWLGRFRRSRV